VTAPLWGSRSRLVLAAGWAIGLLVVLTGWWGVSGEAAPDDQYRWLVLGVLGMTVCLAAGTAWVFTGLRTVGTRIRLAVPVPPEVVEGITELRLVPDGHDEESARLVAASGMRYYHRPSCTLAQGKAVRPAERSEHLRAGRVACGVCRPDDVALGVSAA
jgi:hypothetical protein